MYKHKDYINIKYKNKLKNIIKICQQYMENLRISITPLSIIYTTNSQPYPNNSSIYCSNK